MPLVPIVGARSAERLTHLALRPTALNYDSLFEHNTETAQTQPTWGETARALQNGVRTETTLNRD